MKYYRIQIIRKNAMHRYFMIIALDYIHLIINKIGEYDITLNSSNFP